MRFIAFLLLVLLQTSSFSSHSFAQAQKKKYQPIIPDGSNYISDANYQSMTRQLIANPIGFRYDLYRKHYITSRFYEPLPDDLRAQMLDYAYIIQTSDDREKVIEARKAYDAIIMSQLANMAIVTLALSLSREDKRLGNVEFFEEIRKGLFNHVLVSGDGKTLKRAYDVITLVEETMLLNYLNVKVLKTVPAKEGIWYYNMHDIENPATGQVETVFVNITIPMRVLEQEQLNKERALNLPR